MLYGIWLNPGFCPHGHSIQKTYISIHILTFATNFFVPEQLFYCFGFFQPTFDDCVPQTQSGVMFFTVKLNWSESPGGLWLPRYPHGVFVVGGYIDDYPQPPVSMSMAQLARAPNRMKSRSGPLFCGQSVYIMVSMLVLTIESWGFTIK